MGLIATLVVSDYPTASAKTQQPAGQSNTGYSVLKLLLEDEQHLTLIRRTKMIITFDGISTGSEALIDSISDASEKDLETLERLSSQRPAILFEEFSDDTIGKATLDSLRMTTAKEFFIGADDFEKSILLSQLKVLRVISHLAEQLEQKESNHKRKRWLKQLSDRYEGYYQQVNTRFTIKNNT